MVDTPVTVVKGRAPIPAPAEEGRTWIILEENSNIPPTGLYLGVNGDGCLVRAGEKVHLPNRYLEVLDHAIEGVAQQNSQFQLTGATHGRQRFAYRVTTPPV
jgi:hypothetical protein